MTSLERKRNQLRSFRKRFVKVASRGFAVLVPILGIVNLRPSPEPPAPPSQMNVAVSVTVSSGNPDTKDPNAHLVTVALQQQMAKEKIRAIAETRAKDGSAGRAASIIRKAFAPGSIPIETVLAILMSLIALYAQAVFDKLVEHRADETATSVEKMAGSIKELFKKDRDTERDVEFFKKTREPKPGVKEARRDLQVHDLGSLLMGDAFETVRALRSELSEQSPSGSEIIRDNTTLGAPGAKAARLHAHLPLSAPIVRAFQDPATDLFEALQARLGKADAESLADYVRQRVAEEALNYLIVQQKLLALQSILDSPIVSAS